MWALPRSLGGYTVDKHAFNKRIGCVLLQKQLVGTDRLIGYWSRLINDAKRVNTMTHRKRPTVVRAVILLLLYLHICLLTVRNDQDVITWIIYLMHSKGKLAHWQLRSSEFTLDLFHSAGIKRQEVHSLSQL